MQERELTVRVLNEGGAPRITVNGRIVRPRMFFGGPGTNPVPVGSEWTPVRFEFTATADAEGRGTMHFRFGKTPGLVLLDDIVVTDAETGETILPRATFEDGQEAFQREWSVWPPGERNTVGQVDTAPGLGRGGSAALRVRLRNPDAGSWPDFHIYSNGGLKIVRGRTYRVELWSKADPPRELTIGFYRPGPVYVHLGGPPGLFERQIELAAKAGVHFVSFIVPTPWPEPGKPEDWAGVDAECDRVLRANPDALLLPRFGLEPPAWWAERYADHMMLWEDGSRRVCASPASLLYRQAAAERTRALVRHLEEKYGSRVAGYHPCGHNTGEWFYEETWGSLLNGYSRADLEGWRRWLSRRYVTDAALREAWKDPQATIAGAQVPSAAERRAAPNGFLRNPGTERRLVDFALFQQDAMAELVCDIARATREASGGRKLVVFFYGYGYEFGPVHLGPATSGHYAMRKVLESPDIDILCSPISYGDRGLAQTGPVMSAAESVALTGTKMWLQEDDTRTHCSPDEADAIARLSNLWETQQVLTRNVANEATRNMATWWMDLGMTGWFKDPALWTLMERLRPLDEVFMARPYPFRPEIASILDERSALLMAPGFPDVSGQILYNCRHALGRTGAPYGQYLLDDVLAGKVRARLYVFHNAFWLKPEERQALLKATHGAVRLWLYAPGAFDDGGASPEAMRDLTGFLLEQVENLEAWATPTPQGQRRGLREAFGMRRALKPLWAAWDAAPSEKLAVYSNGAAAVAMRRGPAGTDVFVGVPSLTPELLRVAARAAGVHLYAEDDTCIWANGPIVAVQAVRDGPVTVRLPRPGVVSDALTSDLLGSGSSVRLTMKRGEVRTLRVR